MGWDAEGESAARVSRSTDGGTSWQDVATLAVDRADVVQGILYRLPPSELLALDIYEGAPVVYERVRIYVRDVLGRRRRAWTYVMCSSRFEHEPSVDYLVHILRAYIKHGFNRRALLVAAHRSAA